ncbi:tetratricopeptide repeat protein [Pyrococcus sp. NA2]|uniref:tetratricopeptide repeat protein n=1 Tax=Pyrococcus sp. (strain NA2) TaxID=342949 RepID=UPI00064E75C3|nr:tetratricopeptide repeat protein [Pyrococcus sp. NA2]
MKVEDIVLLARMGVIDRAIEEIHKLKDPLERVIALSRVGETIKDENLLEDALYIVKRSIKDVGDKVFGYSEIGVAYSRLGNRESALECFKNALKLLGRLEDYEAGIVGMSLGAKLALAGFYEISLDVFDFVFDSIIELEIDVLEKTDLIMKLGEVLEDVGDTLPSMEALKFYERAYYIFENLRMGERARTIEKKMEVARTLRISGFPEVRKLALEGQFRDVLNILERLTGGKRIIGILELSLWAKKIESHERFKLSDVALEELKTVDISDEEKVEVVKLLSRLELFESAFDIAREISNGKARDEALYNLAKELINAGEREFASKVISLIESQDLKEVLAREMR